MKSPVSIRRKRVSHTSFERNKKSGTKLIGCILFATLCGSLIFFWSTSDVLLTEELQRSLSAATEAGYLRLQTPLQDLMETKDTVIGKSKEAHSSKYVPLACPEVLKKARSSTTPKNFDPNRGVLHGKQVETDPKFWISLHNEEFDPTRWSIMKYGVYYEKALTKSFLEVLKNSTAGSRVLDVGGNIGFFSLLSAANGPVVVDTFEPNAKNQLRMCESLLLNNWHNEYDDNYNEDPKTESRVNLIPLGVGRKEGAFSFEESTNPGMGKFHEVQGVPNSKAIHVLTLDNFARERGWFASRPDIAILKVDVEGMEYTVIEGGKNLLKSGIVRNIFMEVSARTPIERELNKPSLAMLRDTGYKLHKVGGWAGPNRDVDFPLDGDIAEHIMVATDKQEVKQLNLWWTLDK